MQREQEQQTNVLTEIDSDGSENPRSSSTSKAPFNAFDMLNAVDPADESDGDEDLDDERNVSTTKEEVSERQTASLNASKPKSKRKKKKQKKKTHPHAPPAVKIEKKTDQEMDEIDKALKDLDVNRPAQTRSKDQSFSYSEWEVRVGELLAVEQKNLNPLNEMKSLFGNLALEQEDRRSNTSSRQRGPQQLDLGTALMGRYSPASKGEELGSLASARNCFLQGRAEWPRAFSGGLSMELESKDGQQIRKYTYQRNPAYQRTQTEYEMAVESMQPEHMVRLLQVNPYHISTLIQVSEIAKHQGDHSVAGDLLERALFTFGRSVHSTFSPALRSGLARLNFHEAQSREFFLTTWRYLVALEMRGTWRTAFEWAKLLLSLDPLSDPYGITHLIDQYALRGRQHNQLIALCDPEAFGKTWSHLPNISISLALAHLRSSPRLARQQLATAMQKYPYILSRLCSELDISRIPKALWGVQPKTEAEKLYTELYATRAKDLWNTLETIALLIEVADTLDAYDTDAAKDVPKLEVSLEDARHVFLTEKPALIGLLPHRFKSKSYSPSDPLPPPSLDSLGNEGLTARAPGTERNANGGLGMDLLESVRGIGGANWLGAALNMFRRGASEPEPASEGNASSSDSITSEGGTRHAGDPDESNMPRVAQLDTLNQNGDIPPNFNAQEFATLMQAIAGADSDEVEEDWANVSENVRQEIMQNFTRGSDDPETEDEEIGEVENHASPPVEPAVSNQDALERSVLEESGSSALEAARDPQRIQRYLLGKGFADIQAYMRQHGTNITEPKSNMTTPIGDYLANLSTLNTRERRWVLQMVHQRDREIGAMLDRLV